MWLKTPFAKPSMDDHFTCVLPFAGAVNEHIATLAKYKEALPYIAPSGRLWHPDLQADEVYIKGQREDTLSVTAPPNWTGACVGPAYIDLCVPTFVLSHFAPRRSVWRTGASRLSRLSQLSKQPFTCGKERYINSSRSSRIRRCSRRHSEATCFGLYIKRSGRRGRQG